MTRVDIVVVWDASLFSGSFLSKRDRDTLMEQSDFSNAVVFYGELNGVFLHIVGKM